jgi:hypothetical protein
MTFVHFGALAAFRTAKLHDAAILDHDQTLHACRSTRYGNYRFCVRAKFGIGRAFSETESEPGWSGGIVIPELAL